MRTSTSGNAGMSRPPLLTLAKQMPGHRAADTDCSASQVATCCAGKGCPMSPGPAWGCQRSQCHSAGLCGALLGVSVSRSDVRRCFPVQLLYHPGCCHLMHVGFLWFIYFYFFFPHLFQACSEHEWDKDWCGSSPSLDKAFFGEEAFVSAPEAAAFQPGTCQVSWLFFLKLHFYVFLRGVSRCCTGLGCSQAHWLDEWRAEGSSGRRYCPRRRAEICSYVRKTNHNFQKGGIRFWSDQCIVPSHLMALQSLYLVQMKQQKQEHPCSHSSPAHRPSPWLPVSWVGGQPFQPLKSCSSFASFCRYRHLRICLCRCSLT